MVKQEIKSFYMDLGEHKGLAAFAPCSLYSVLYENKIIGDPSVSDNVAKIAHYSSGGCVFYSEFEITPLVMSMKNVLLRFSGLDTLCTVELNGQKIGETNNMHRTYDFDVKAKINLGKNSLKLTFLPPKQSQALRKAYSMLGTDSSPALFDMGIFRKVEIVAFNHKIISDVTVKQTHLDGAVRLDMSISTVGYDELSRTVATLTSPAGNVYFCGFVGGEGSLTINDPNLWWPNGLGMQNLYKLNVNLYSESEIEDTYEMRIGLRTVAFTGEKEDRRLFVNGIPVMVMGGEYMIEDILPSRLSEKKTRELLENTKTANFNSIYIHGTGVYPEKYLLDACDELGLIVWMELPLCASDKEDSPELTEALKDEFKDNLGRMAHHPSLAVIVGNERVERLFGTRSEADRFFGSFSSFEGMNVFDLNGECKDRLVRVGYSSLPTYDSIVDFTENSERNLGSRIFELHGATESAVMEMLSKAYESYPYANGMNELSYVMGLCSAEASRSDVLSYRREAKKPLGILMRRMNDTWPSLSPSSVDYYGRKKPLYYLERSFFSPVCISVRENGTRVRFIVTNDTKQDYVGVFAYAIMNNRNKPVFRDSFPIRARASSNLEVHNVDLGSVLSGHEDEYYLIYSVSDKSTEAPKGTHLFTKTKRFNFLKPNYSIEIFGNGREYVATVSADCFVKGVEIYFDGEDAVLDKNYFDITSSAPVRIRITTPRVTTVEKLNRLMRVRSVYDLGREE